MDDPGACYLVVQSLIPAVKNNPDEAIPHLKKAVDLLPFEKWHEYSQMFIIQHVEFIEPLAEAYYRSGDLVRAEEQYKRLTGLTTARIGYGDRYAKAFYWLGRIYEEKDWKGKAIEAYERFIELWGDCDPEFQPLIEEARTAVYRLR